MDLGVSLPTVGPVGRRKYVLQVAQAADQLGFHSVWVSSHVALPKERHSTCLYPRATTSDAYNWGVAWLDPVAVMGLVAGATERVVIGTHVMALPYRNPVILANEMAALDELSLGRIVLGAGIGWMDEEFTTVGIPRKERGARTDEYMKVMRTLWTGRHPTSFHGRFFDFDDMWLASRPYSDGGPPIYVGGNSEPALRRVARYGDGWLAHELYPDEIVPAREQLIRQAEETGRDPGSIRLTVRRGLVPPFEVMNFMSDRLNITGSAEQVAEEVEAYRKVGISLMVLDLNLRPGEMVATLEWLAKEVMPLLG
ncbi:MAG: TIGR03619 family F420-dependent LLM class oxidoreductase [Streptomyces sp.]|nr:TIGR03619 family F420-dependent LLM class oxidoreductase [Streptomyces sp.]